FDCNSNGIPDECEVPVKQSRTVLYHDFEANTAQPFFTASSSVVGQPTADPLVAVTTTGDPTADGNPSWFVPVGAPDTLPDLANAPISTLRPCPVGGGFPPNEQSIGMFIDLSRRVDLPGSYTGQTGSAGGPWTLRSGTFNRTVSGVHFNREVLTV